MVVLLRRPLLTALAACLLALYAWTAWSASLGKSPAFDESAHLTAGYTYWKFNDYRLQPENGNLPQRWAGLALLPLAPRLDHADHSEFWRAADVWNIGQRLLYETGNPPELMLAAGRGAMVFWGVACGLLVFFWSRRLWGDTGALFSLLLFTGSSTLLAHGPMITSDVVAAFFLLSAPSAFWLYLKKSGPCHLGLSLLLTGLAAVAKFSFLLLAPIYVGLMLWHWCSRPTAVGAQVLTLRIAMEALRAIGLAITHTLAAVFIVWASFGFRYAAEAPGLPPKPDLYIPWNELLPDQGLRRETLIALKQYKLLPEAYTHGFAYVLRASEARGAFAAGEFSSTGWWWFFPYAFFIKSTLAELAAVAILAAIAIRRWLQGIPIGPLNDLSRFAPLLILIVVYGTASITSSLNIGHRHILPLYLPLFIFAGALLRPTAGQSTKALALALILLTTIEASSAYPNYLAYFNPLAGPADKRWKHLVDSSLDWGQDLPALAEWLKQNRQASEPVFLSYFGIADPRHEGIDAKQFAPFFSLWRPPSLASLTPGLYCISATVLQGPYSPLTGPWSVKFEATFQNTLRYYTKHPEELDDSTKYVNRDGTRDEHRRWVFERTRFARLAYYLQIREPDAVLNSSILVYRLNAREVALAQDASLAEMNSLLELAMLERNLKEVP